MVETKAFVYKWTHTPTNKWYIGSRSRTGCHPDDGYICSSKIVKPMIKTNPEEWSREILKMGSPSEMRKHESSLLKMYNAKADPMSFNQSNAECPTNGGRTKGTKNPSSIMKTEKRLLAEYSQHYKKYPDLSPREMWKMGTKNLVSNLLSEKNDDRRFLYIVFIADFIYGEQI